MDGFNKVDYGYAMRLSLVDLMEAFNDAADWSEDAGESFDAIEEAIVNDRMTAPLRQEFISQETANGSPVCSDGWAKVDKVYGNTVVWNQLIQNGDFADGTSNWSVSNGSFTASEGIATFVTSANYASVYSSTIEPIKEGHKYLIQYDVLTSSQVVCYINSPTSAKRMELNTSSGYGSWQTKVGILTSQEDSSSPKLYFQSPAGSNEYTIKLTKIMVLDLTLIYGAGNEPSTVAEFEATYKETYYQYCAPKLLSVDCNGIHGVTDCGFDADELRSAGTARDVQTAGAIERHVGYVNLGTLEWSYRAPNNAFYATISDMKAYVSVTNYCGMSCAKYTPSSPMGISAEGADKTIVQRASADNQVIVFDSGYSNKDTFKAAMNGVYLCYELATPNTTPIDPPNSMYYKVEAGGTESLIVDTSQPAPQSAPIIADIAYPRNNEAYYITAESFKNFCDALGTYIEADIEAEWDGSAYQYTFTEPVQLNQVSLNPLDVSDIEPIELEPGIIRPDFNDLEIEDPAIEEIAEENEVMEDE